MVPMDGNVKLVKYSLRKDSVFVDANEKPRAILNAQNARDVQNNTIARIKKYTIRQNMYDFFFWYQIWSLLLFPRKLFYWLMLNLSTKPGFVLPMITTIFMTIGIVVVCFTAPKSSGMSLLFYILHIQYDKSSQLIRFCFISIVSFDKKKLNYNNNWYRHVRNKSSSEDRIISVTTASLFHFKLALTNANQPRWSSPVNLILCP